MTTTEPRDEAGKAPLIINGLTVRPRDETKGTDSWSLRRQKAAGYVGLFAPWEIALPFVAIALGMDGLLRWLDTKKGTDVSEDRD